MNPKLDAERVKEIFENAIDLASSEERRGYVNGVCDGDAELQARVQTLLRVHFEGESAFLPENPRLPPLHPFAGGEIAGKPGTIIGRYKLLQEIGEGGCGVVWMAEQEQPVRRRVALKVIKLGMDTKSVIARFEAERQALAMMDHPNIAKVLDAGATDAGRPFFVMELVRGIRLTKYCDQHKLPVRERLDLFIKVCQAIQHAHQKGVIHRDIKPSNILVTLHDGVPVPKVIDFGIAKATDQRLTDKTLFTQFDSFIGTPAYMSPEQAEMSGLDIDTRTDIYSLGVLLYELLTGVTPFNAQTLAQSGLDEMRRIIREDEPRRPSARLSTLAMTDATALAKLRQEKLPALTTLVRGDLDWIVMKCLEKDRTRRYETANGLVADIRRHLSNEVIVARPPTAGYRMQKAVRRNRVAFAAGTAVAVALVAGIVISSWQAVRAKSAEQAARLAEHSERVQSERARSDRDRAVRAEAAAKNAEAATRDELANARAALTFIQDDLLGQASPDRQPDPNLTLRTLLDQASASFDQRTALPPKVEAAIRQTIGWVNFTLGEYKIAIGHLNRALALRRQHLGPAHEDTLRTLHVLSESHWGDGNDRRATELAQEGWDLSRRALGETHLMTLHFLADVVIAPAYAEAGTIAEIDLRINEAFRTISATLGDTHKLTFRLKVALGRYKLSRGKFVEAEEILSQAIESQRSVLRESDPLVLEAMATLARVYGNIPDFDQAARLVRRVLELRQSLLGPNHALTVSTEIHLALIYRKRGDFPNADKIHTRLLNLLAAGGLVQTREVGTKLLALLINYRRQKDWVKVDELADAVLTASRKQFKDETVSFQLIDINHEWARSLMAQERYPEAEPHFRRAVEIRIQRNSTHGRRFAAMSGLGECLFKQNKDFNRAEFLLQTACDELELRFSQLPEYLRLEILGGALLRLAEFYKGTGRPAEANVYKQKLAELENTEGRPLLSRDPLPIF